MECGLQWKDITCWDEVPRLTLTHEETLEAAIPDYCPDMGRVVEASGTLCLRSITARSGNLELKGHCSGHGAVYIRGERGTAEP